MMDDPIRAVRNMDAIVASYSGRERERLDVLRRRLVGEMVGDLEAVRATVTPGFSFIARGGGTERVIGAGETDAAIFVPLCTIPDLVLWLDWYHLVADRDTVAGDGVMSTCCQGTTTPRYGVEVEDPDAYYLIRAPIALFLEYEDGLIAHEVTYSDPAARGVRRLEDAEAPTRDQVRQALTV